MARSQHLTQRKGEGSPQENKITNKQNKQKNLSRRHFRSTSRNAFRMEWEGWKKPWQIFLISWPTRQRLFWDQDTRKCWSFENQWTRYICHFQVPHPASVAICQFFFCSLFTEVAAAFPILSAKLLQLQLYPLFNTSMKYLSNYFLTDEGSPPPPVAGNRLFSVSISRSGKKLISTTLVYIACKPNAVSKPLCKSCAAAERLPLCLRAERMLTLFKEPKKAAIHNFLLTFHGKHKGDKGDITFFFF